MSDAGSKAGVSAGPGLLEREREVGELDSGITAAVAGDAAVVLVEGPAGIGKSRPPLVSYELRHIGGALARAATGHGAIASLQGKFLTFGVAMVFGEESQGAARDVLERVRRVLAPHDTGRKYLNFAEQETDPAVFYAPETWGRLRAVKVEVDPGRLFRANHSIDPAS